MIMQTSLYCKFFLGAGTDLTSGTLNTSWNSELQRQTAAVGQVNLADSTSNEWYITGVQLEAGTAASDFEFLPVDVNLRRCQRYFYKKIAADAYGPLAQGIKEHPIIGSRLSSSYNEIGHHH